MRIGIDYSAASRQRAGIGRYTRSLVNALARLDTSNQYTLHIPINAKYIEDAQRFPGNYHLKRAPLDERSLTLMWQRARLPLPIETFIGAQDIFYSPDFVLAPTRAHKKILTVHDLSFRRVPETAIPNLKWYLEDAVPRSIKRADLILADSDATRRDLIELFDTPPDRVETLYSGYEDFFRPPTQETELAYARETYKLDRPFILSVGTIEPRKNFTRLIEAFARIPQHKRFELLIAGGRGWMVDEIYQAPARFGVSDSVRFLGFVPDRDLPALFNLATLFVYPSLYEGFGLPVLEALACGAAVITSNTSSLPEVAGDAALLIDPHNTVELAEGLEYLIEDDGQRTILRGRALVQAKKFSWESGARQLRAAFEI